ncbi:unnamed protein product, partial [Discosporangium mesarthrocarpum]
FTGRKRNAKVGLPPTDKPDESMHPLCSIPGAVDTLEVEVQDARSMGMEVKILRRKRDELTKRILRLEREKENQTVGHLAMMNAFREKMEIAMVEKERKLKADLTEGHRASMEELRGKLKEETTRLTQEADALTAELEEVRAARRGRPAGTVGSAVALLRAPDTVLEETRGPGQNQPGKKPLP